MKANAAVMAQRSAAVVEADDPQRALYRKLDFFPTPPWAARAGAELIRELYPQTRYVWEPACGEGHLAQPLREYFHCVKSTDIYDHGFGGVQDFLAPFGAVPSSVAPDGAPPSPSRGEGISQWDAIVTNPPFARAAEFVRRGLLHAPVVAVLCRLAFLESEERYGLHYEDPGLHLHLFAPFTERVAMQLGSWDPDLSTATAYAWFIYERGPRAVWPPCRPIAPGAKRRLTRADDARRFAKLADAPLFGDATP